MRSSPRSAFTLIEILTVIAIIAVLASLILATSGYVQERAGRARAEAEIQALSNAIEAYKLDNGDYPQGDGGPTSTNDLIDALVPAAGSGGKVYFEIPIKMFQGYRSGTDYEAARNAANALVDPFGNPYRYYYNAAAAQTGNPATNPVTGSQNNGPQFFDLWSYGKDGATKNAATPDKWIKNW